MTQHNHITTDPVIQFVDEMIANAIEQRASDIHIEPQEQHCRIRVRRDGLLSELTSLPAEFAKLISTRLKILAQMNIAETRLPQDGRLRSDHDTDIRASTCPTLFGEKIVLRLLNPDKHIHDIQTLGMSKEQETLLFKILSLPQGLILATGPTGSGKTMTLYSALQYLNSIEKNIITVEDPIEIKLLGINQTNIHPRIGFTFATALRALLRQDPDIIMIGEIRDSETAAIAIQAAQTGHLVLSTLHTNSARESVERLLSFGIDKQTLTATIALVINQRLVRKICAECSRSQLSLPLPAQSALTPLSAQSALTPLPAQSAPTPLSAQSAPTPLSAQSAPTPLSSQDTLTTLSSRGALFATRDLEILRCYTPQDDKEDAPHDDNDGTPQSNRACHHCHQGYSGRTGIFELITHLTQQPEKTLWQAGDEKIQAGITSAEELARLVPPPITSIAA